MSAPTGETGDRAAAAQDHDARVREVIDRLVDQAPPLGPQQRQRIRAIFTAARVAAGEQARVSYSEDTSASARDVEDDQDG